MSKEDNLQLVIDCEDRESRMSDWEVKFIASIRDRIEKEWALTEPQYEKLNTIWKKVTEDG